MRILLIIICLFTAITTEGLFSAEYQAILQAKLHAISNSAHELKTAKIQPGSTIKLEAEIKNIGNVPSAPGKIFVRFSLTEPLEDLLESRLFQTEKVDLPTIFPGQVIVIKFSKEHQWPTIHDFVKQNWNMRHYQAMINIEGENKDKVIGYLPIFFSAYYYEGLRQETPQAVPAKKVAPAGS